jgi:hypothetical protein
MDASSEITGIVETGPRLRCGACGGGWEDHLAFQESERAMANKPRETAGSSSVTAIDASI